MRVRARAESGRDCAENSVAPLSHHTLDSTHISMGVITIGVDHGPWTVESSVFRFFNDFPVPAWLSTVVWTVMQFGNFGSVSHPQAKKVEQEKRTT